MCKYVCSHAYSNVCAAVRAPCLVLDVVRIFRLFSSWSDALPGEYSDREYSDGCGEYSDGCSWLHYSIQSMPICDGRMQLTMGLASGSRLVGLLLSVFCGVCGGWRTF